MDCEKNIKCLSRSKKDDFNCVVGDITLKCILKIKTCCGVSDYFVIKNGKDNYQLYDLCNKYIPNTIMVEVNVNHSTYYKKVENTIVNDINEFKILYPVVEIIDLESVEGLDFDEFLRSINNRE